MKMTRSLIFYPGLLVTASEEETVKIWDINDSSVFSLVHEKKLKIVLVFWWFKSNLNKLDNLNSCSKGTDQLCQGLAGLGFRVRVRRHQIDRPARVGHSRHQRSAHTILPTHEHERGRGRDRSARRKRKAEEETSRPGQEIQGDRLQVERQCLRTRHKRKYE